MQTEIFRLSELFDNIAKRQSVISRIKIHAISVTQKCNIEKDRYVSL